MSTPVPFLSPNLPDSQITQKWTSNTTIWVASPIYALLSVIRQQMSPFDPFRGGAAKRGQCPLFFTVFLKWERPLLNFVRSTHKREFNEHFETVFLRSHKTDFFNMIISKWRIIDTDLYWQSPKRQQFLWILTKTQWNSVFLRIEQKYNEIQFFCVF